MNNSEQNHLATDFHEARNVDAVSLSWFLCICEPKRACENMYSGSQSHAFVFEVLFLVKGPKENS